MNQNDDTAEKFRNLYEPLFGVNFNTFISQMVMGDADRQILRRRIDSRVGADQKGGYIMDYACGRISLKQYLMKCQLKNVADFNVNIIEDMVKFWESWISNNNWVWWKDIMDYMRSRLKALRYELRQLYSKMNDLL